MKRQIRFILEDVLALARAQEERGPTSRTLWNF